EASGIAPDIHVAGASLAAWIELRQRHARERIRPKGKVRNVRPLCGASPRAACTAASRTASGARSRSGGRPGTLAEALESWLGADAGYERTRIPSASHG